MKKLFGGLKITWPKLILFAVICGVYTAVMALKVPDGISFRDIAISYEWWILFAILIIVNSTSPLDSALKTFVFFLISQPLVYLVQAPFHPQGFGLFTTYYRFWFFMTLLTFPMAYVGYYMKKDKWWGLLILAPMLVFLGWHYSSFLSYTITYFPYRILSTVFCAVTMILYPLYIFHDKKIRTAGLILSLVLLLAGTVYGVMNHSATAYDTEILYSDGQTAGVAFDDSYKVSLADDAFGAVDIQYDEQFDCYKVHAVFTKYGDTQLVLEAPDGTQYVYDLTVGSYTYDIKQHSGS